jgi:3-isopropylmalate dehydrogenase
MHSKKRPGTSAQPFKIVVMPGDGVGPEVCREAQRALELVVAKAGRALTITECAIGAQALRQGLPPLPPATADAALDADAILFGAVGDPAYDERPIAERPEQGLGSLRRLLGVYANLRPVRTLAALAPYSSLRAELVSGTDLVVVRELLGDVYYGTPRGISGNPRRAVNTMSYEEGEIRRVAKLAFELARRRRKRLTSVDKSNALETSRLWREVVTEVGRDYADVELRHVYVDAMAYALVRTPREFDVILTSNLFGDILSDEAAVLAGSIGLLPSASLGEGPGLFEPIHGAASDIAGRGIANPIGALASVSELLRWSLGLETAAALLDRALDAVLESGVRTPDLGGHATTMQVGDEVLGAIERLSAAAITSPS